MYKQICYISFLAKGVSSESVVEEIKKVSEVNNARDGITGQLQYSNSIFLQLIEGPEDKIEQLYSRIEKDPRHMGSSILFDRMSNSRTFPKWEMIFKRVDKLELQKLNEAFEIKNEFSAKDSVLDSDVEELFSRF